MKLNIHILFDELKEFSPKLATSRGIELNLRKIRIPELLDINLDNDCIYLMEASAIEEQVQLLGDIDLISIGYIDTQNELFTNLSVISFPQDCDASKIFNKIQDIFEKYGQWDYDLVHMIATKKPLQVVADTAATFLTNPFALLDVTLSKILIGGPIPKDYKGSIWKVVIEESYTPIETYSIPSDVYLSQLHSRKPRIASFPPFEQYSHLLSNLFVDNKLIAIIAMTDINSPLTQGQVSLIQHISGIMELALASSTEIKGSSESVVYYMENLIKGFQVDEKILSFHLVKRGWNICGNFRIYTIANPDGKELSDSQAKFCIYRIKKLQDDTIIFSYENFIIVITRQSKSEVQEEYQDDLAALLTNLGLRCGCSHIFDRFSDLKYYYIQSKAALYEGEKNNSDGVIWNFGDYYFSHIISSLDNSTSLKAMCHPSVRRLYEHDKAYGTDYVKCLRVYLLHGCNIAQSGKELFMHRNTLVYRLEKIAEIIETDVQQLGENERMQLWLSCLLCGRL